MIQKVALALFLFISAVILGVLVLASTRPAAYHVERSVVVAVAPETVYGLVADLRRFPEWSPWQDLDPTMHTDWSGPASGPGVSYHWVGDDKVGEGRMTLRQLTPPQEVAIALDFLKPFEASSDLVFTFKPVIGGTNVTWRMSGRNNFMAKVMTLFVDMDAAVGRDFERGLARLERLVESAPPPAPATPAVADSTDEAFPDTALAR